MFDEQRSTLYRYATALNNIGVAVMERHIFDEASCILEDAAAVAQFLQCPTEGSDTNGQMEELLQMLPASFNQAAQRLAVISTQAQTQKCVAGADGVRVVSTSLDDWSPQALLEFAEDNEKCTNSSCLYAIRMEHQASLQAATTPQSQLNLDLSVIVHNWAVATYGWSQAPQQTSKDSRALLETSLALFHDGISMLRINGPLTDLDQHGLRLVVGWVLGLQNLTAVVGKDGKSLLAIRGEIQNLVRQLAELDHCICVFDNRRGPACAA